VIDSDGLHIMASVPGPQLPLVDCIVLQFAQLCHQGG
jgi:hypothetical protein